MNTNEYYYVITFIPRIVCEMDINFIDTIVSRSANKGTSIITGAVKPSEFMGLQNKTIEEQRLKLALDLRIMGAKGTTKIRT